MPEPAPRKGRPPKCPPNVRIRWSPKLGWRFRAVLTLDGHKHAGAWRATKDEAQRDVLDMRQRAVQAKATPELVTVGEGIRLFLQRAEERGFQKRKRHPCRSATVEFYREITDTILREVGSEVLLHTMDSAMIQDYLAHRAGQERKRCKCAEKALDPCEHPGRRPSASRLNKERGTWSRIFQTVIDDDLHPGPNPVDRVDEYSEERREAPHYPIEKVAEILKAIRSHEGRCSTATWFADIVALLFLSGLRLGELAHLRVRDIDLGVPELLVPREGKTGSRRLPLREPHLTVLGRLIEDRGDDDFLLPGETLAQRHGNVKSNLFRRWRDKMPEELRNGFHAHSFRHSYETHLLEMDVPPHHVKALMGHADRTMTDRYAHADQRRLRQSMANAFDEVAGILWPHSQAEQSEATSG